MIAAAGLIYTAGLLLMTVSSTPLMAHLSIGVFTGFAMSGAMFPIILGDQPGRDAREARFLSRSPAPAARLGRSS